MKLADVSLVVVFMLIVAIFTAFLFRFELVPAQVGGEGGYGLMYRIDRWTGQIEVIQGTQIHQLVRK
jgi:hypothetical protein